MKTLRLMAVMAMATMGAAILALPAVASVPCAYSTENGVIHPSPHRVTNMTPAPSMKDMDFLTVTLVAKATAPPRLGLSEGAGWIIEAAARRKVIEPVDTIVNIRPEGGGDTITGQTLGLLMARGSDKKLLERPKKKGGGESGLYAGHIRPIGGDSRGDNGSAIIGRGGGILYAT